MLKEMLGVCSPEKPVSRLHSESRRLETVSGRFVGELDGTLVSNLSPMDIPQEITISSVNMRPTQSALKDIFIAENHSTLQQFQYSWRKGGVVQVISDYGERLALRICPAWMLSHISSCVHWLNRMYPLLPLPSLFTGVSDPDQAPCFGPRRQHHAVVHRIRWHGQCQRLAVLLSDDSVSVFAAGSTGSHQMALVSTLQHRLQHCVNDISWRPFSLDIAIACASATLIVSTDNTGSGWRGSSSPGAQVLSAAGHSPVFSVEWSPNGDMLVTCGKNQVLLWHVASERHISLAHSVFCSSGPLWSPSGRRLLAPLASGVFRVWDTVSWQSFDKRIGDVCAGFITTCCWSSDEKTLLFSCSASPGVYGVEFGVSALTANSRLQISEPSLLIDTVAVSDESGTASKSVGGIVSSMCWDKTGTRLALLFEDCSSVAVFIVDYSPVFTATPCGIISEASIPVDIQFQNNSQTSPVLSICWSDGRIQHVPMRCARSTAVFSSSFAVDNNRNSSALLQPLSDKSFQLPSITPNSPAIKLFSLDNTD